MKKYIIEYGDYDEIISILNNHIPHTNLDKVTTVIIDLYEDEYIAIKKAGYNIKEDRFVMGSDALCYTPTDMLGSQVPPTDLLNYYNVWNSHAAGFTGAGVKVALIDTGQHDNHHAAAPAVTRHDFTIGQTGSNLEPQSHGGRGCIHIGQTNLFTGTSTPGAAALYGIAYGCDLHSMRVMEDDTSLYNSSVISAIDYCIANNFDIINISLSMGSGLDLAVYSALAAGIIVVCASGNNVFGSVAHPADVLGVIAVNAWDTGAVAGSHITGDNETKVTIVNYISGHTSFAGGTSQGAFMLTGLLAIYKQKYPSLNTEKAVHLLKRRALTIDGFTYDRVSVTNTKGILENYQTGAGFIAPIN